MEYTEVERERLAKLERLRQASIDPYPSRAAFVGERLMATEAIERAQLLKFESAAQPEAASNAPSSTPSSAPVAPPQSHLETGPVAIMGRIVTRRVMGKASFVQVEDGSGRIQLYARIGEDSIPAESFALFKDLDLGDFIEARGPLFITKTGEPSLRITAWNLLSKSISPLPIAKEEKQPDGSIVRHNAFSSPELRYRQRYADLAVNPDVRTVFRKRSALIKSIRDFLDGEDFLEVETPVLQALYGGAAAKPFITHHNQLDQDLYLRISFELYLKRLIVGNIERVYEIGRDFRNEGVSYKHNPEFTMLELYAAYMDMYSIMDLTERMVQHVAQRVTPDGNGMIEWRGHRISMLEPWHRKTLREAILEYTDIDYTQYPTAESLQKAIKAAGLDYSPNAKTWGKLVDGLMGDYVEKNLIHPTFLYEYPRDISPFAKSKAGDPNTVERFEGFAAGMELCNAFSELNDPIDQHQRFRDEATNAEGDEANPVDEDYVRALMYGMPTCGGLGIGIDRLAMLFAGKDTVREVILFPHLRQDE